MLDCFNVSAKFHGKLNCLTNIFCLLCFNSAIMTQLPQICSTQFVSVQKRTDLIWSMFIAQQCLSKTLRYIAYMLTACARILKCYWVL